MKKASLFIVTVLVVFSAMAFAAEVTIAGHDLVSSGTYAGASGFGLGIMFGDNNALVLKSWINSIDAMQYDLEYNLYGKYAGIGVAYLIHNFDIIKVEDNKVPLYFGLKVYAAVYNGTALCAGVEVPLGIDWIFKNYPIDISFDVDPGVQFINPSGASRFAWGDGIGARYWF